MLACCMLHVVMHVARPASRYDSIIPQSSAAPNPSSTLLNSQQPPTKPAKEPVRASPSPLASALIGPIDLLCMLHQSPIASPPLPLPLRCSAASPRMLACKLYESTPAACPLCPTPSFIARSAASARPLPAATLLTSGRRPARLRLQRRPSRHRARARQTLATTCSRASRFPCRRPLRRRSACPGSC